METKRVNAMEEAKKYFKEGLDQWKEDTGEYVIEHPATSGFLAGTAIVWCILVGGALITGKKWYLENK